MSLVDLQLERGPTAMTVTSRRFADCVLLRVRHKAQMANDKSVRHDGSDAARSWGTPRLLKLAEYVRRTFLIAHCDANCWN